MTVDGSPTTGDGPAGVVVLSAADPGRLRDAARRLRAWIAAEADGATIADVAFTLQTGRVALASRVAFRCGDLPGLAAALDAYAAGRPEDPRDLAGPVGAAVREWLAGGDVDWAALWPRDRRPRRVPLPGHAFGRAVPVDAGPVDAGPVDAGPVDVSPRGGDPEAYVCRVVAEAAGLPADRVRPGTPLDQLGLTSMDITTVLARLDREVGRVPRTLFFEHPDLAGVARAAAARHPDRIPAAPAVPPAQSSSPAPSAVAGPSSSPVPSAVAGPALSPGRPEAGPEGGADGRIAVIGIAGRYPGADSVDAFWDVLSTGRDQVRQIPPARRRPGWPADVMWGGFLDDVEHFDPLLFGITPRDAARMDPQERLFLEVVWEALEDAGYPRSRLRRAHGGRVGVYAGVMWNDYPFFGVEQTLAGDPQDSGATTGGVANRVSYALDLGGPSLSVDTMCSSSLTALHLAVRSLRAGECEVAIAGGVNLSLHPNKFRQQQRMQLAASDHRCRSFGEGGDGFVPSEGAGVVLLKPLAAALRDGDRVHAVVRGTAVVHAGRTPGYLVPSPVAQADLVRAALRDGDVDPATVGYLEAHGAGTALGDPVEVGGLERVFGDRGLAPGAIPIGSVKSTIGHVEAAAGIAGLTKVVLQLRHGRYAPTLHAERLNPGVEWDQVPFRVQREAAPWPARDEPRRAGISSFGAGGTIAHAVLEEAPDPRPTRPTPGPAVVVLSAYDEERLGAVVGRMVAHLERSPDVDLGALAYTLQVGREPLRERLAVVVTSTAELLDRLRRVRSGDPAAVSRGRAPADAGGDDPGDPAGPDELADRWVAGRPVDWEARRTGERPSPVPLPSYPFARLRCWLPGLPGDGTTAAGPRSGRLDDRQPGQPPAAGSGVTLYRRGWEDAGAVGAGTWAPGGPVACVVRDAGSPPARALVAALGPACVPVLDAALADDGAAATYADRLLAEHPDLAGWVDVSDVGRDQSGPDSWTGRLTVLQRVVAARAATGLRVLHVTAGLLPAGGVPATLAGAAVAGVVRMLGAEYHRVGATVVDVDPDGTDVAAALAEEWARAGEDAEVCHRAGRRLRPRLEPLPDGPAAGPLRPDGAYVVTGGTRGLGARVARHLAARGARRLVLLGRRPVEPGSPAAATVAELEALGARVLVHTGPLTDRAAVGGLLHRVRAELGPVAGVVHCAGRGGSGRPAFVHKTTVELRAVFEPKAEGLATLLDALAGDRPDFVVLFSSICAAVPALAAGVSDYAAANAYLDLAAGYAARTGNPAVRAVNWPQWLESGGGRDRPDPGAAVGLRGLDDAAALAVLDRVTALPGGEVVLPLRPADGPVDLDALLRPSRGDRTPAPVTAPVPGAALVPAPGSVAVPVSAAVPVAAPVPAPGSVAAPAPVSASVFAPAPASGSEPAGPADWLVRLFGNALGIPVDRLDPTAEFGQLGVDSVLLAELLDGIERRLGRRLDPTLLLDHPSLAELATALGPDATAVPAAPSQAAVPGPPTVEAVPAAGPLQASPVPAVTTPPAPVPVSAGGPLVAAAVPGGATGGGREAGELVAVIGAACRFPGAPDLAAFWDLLEHGRCHVTEVPPERWDTARLYRPRPEPGYSISRWGGFVDGIELFDPDWFGMSEDEATCLDPAIRMLLEAVACATRDAGYADGELAGRDVGVVAGARMSQYGRRVGVRPGALRSDQNFIAAYAAQHFDFRGPNLVVDSACSSSLVAVQLAVRSLLAGESEVAVAAGVEVLLDEEAYVDLSAARALSPTGRCHTFDERADGFVPAEGVGVVVLKRLDRALADGDRIRAVIEGVAVNNDGRTMGVTTPNPAAQAAVVRRALAAAGRRPAEVGMVEAHGTGTVIGDPIELRALTDVFAGVAPGSCPIGSVKSNVGHLLSAAGMAGLLKVVLALEAGVVPPTILSGRPNPRFDFAASPFVPDTRPRPWTERRVAGVSSFGLGGTNAHAILAAAPDRPAGAGRRPLPPPGFARRHLWIPAHQTPTTATPAGLLPAAAPTGTTTSDGTGALDGAGAPDEVAGAYGSVPSNGVANLPRSMTAAVLDLELTVDGVHVR